MKKIRLPEEIIILAQLEALSYLRKKHQATRITILLKRVNKEKEDKITRQGLLKSLRKMEEKELIEIEKVKNENKFMITDKGKQELEKKQVELSGKFNDMLSIIERVSGFDLRRML